ncbi:hypothetical protein D3C76_1394950 [compost metagenome]
MVVVTACDLPAILLGIEVAGIHPQGPVTQRFGVLEAVEPLLVDVFQLRLPYADLGTVVVERIVRADIIETITGESRQP